MANPEKTAQADAYCELLKGAKSVYLADYLGLDVAAIQDLRKECRDESIRFKVVKNRIMKRAVTDIGLGDLGQYLEGPTAVAISATDEVSPAKILVKFAKKHKKPKLKAAIVDGAIYGPEEAEAFAKLPSFNEVRAQLLSVFNAPATQLVRMLATPPGQLARVIDARRGELEEKED
jgi:large subunit ribosomal protein L10